MLNGGFFLNVFEKNMFFTLLQCKQLARSTYLDSVCLSGTDVMCPVQGLPFVLGTHERGGGGREPPHGPTPDPSELRSWERDSFHSTLLVHLCSDGVSSMNTAEDHFLVTLVWFQGQCERNSRQDHIPFSSHNPF